MTTWRDLHFTFHKEAQATPCCPRCGELFDTDFTPNIEAFELCGEVICDDCAEEVFEENGQFGVGA